MENGLSIAILDDYLGIARSLAKWDSLRGVSHISVFDEPMAEHAELASALGSFDVICTMRERTRFDSALISTLPSLRLLTTTGMNNPAIDLEAASRQSVTVCGTSSSYQSTIELAWGLILACARNISREDVAIRHGIWQSRLGFELYGKCLGIVGLGNIGAGMVPVARALGMEVLAWSENLTQERADAVGVVPVSKGELFDRSDVVSVHLRLSPRTRGIIGRAEFQAMKESAILVNTSRSDLVSEEDLIWALTEERIAGAGIDVFHVEPLPKGHALGRLSNVTLSPHKGYVSRENMESFYGQTVENIAAFQSGRPVRVLND